jgi:PAS domain S-box-containing protein
LVSLIVFLILSAAAGGAGHFYYVHLRNQIIEEKKNELHAISELKVRQLVSWRKERFSDASFIFNSRTIADEIAKLSKDPTQARNRKQTLGWMTSMFKNYQYAAISLINTHDEKILSVSDGGVDLISHDASLIRTATQSKKVLFSDLHTEAGKGAFIDIIIPILVVRGLDSTVVGSVILLIDPNNALFPLLQEWPIPSRTSECILIRRDGDEVVFLNRLRHINNIPLALRFPVAEKRLPSAMAARGVEGIVEGKDYRDVEVLAASRRIPDSPWFLIAKSDTEEILASIREDELLIIFLVVSLIMVAGTTLGLLWRNQRAKFYRRQYEFELERKALSAHYDYITKFANDILILYAQDLRIVEANDRALAAYGYSREELLRLNARDLRAPETFSQLDAQLKSIEEQKGFVYETLHRRNDGLVFPVEVSSRVIEIEGRKFYQSIIRDITERKNAEKKIKRLTRVYAILSDINQAIVRVRDRQRLFDETCRIAVEDGLIKLAWFGLVDETTGVVQVVATAGASHGYVEKLRITVGDEPSGRGPTGSALREGKYVICNDIEYDERMTVWREEALANGFHSSAAFPIVTFGKIHAVFSLYAGEKNFFDGEEIKLLEEMSQDISYAMESIKLEEDRKLIDEALKKSEVKYRDLVEQAADGIFIVDKDWKILFVNPRSCEMLGYREEELLRLNIKDTYAPEDIDAADHRKKETQSGSNLQIERNMRRKDGSVFPVEVSVRVLKDGNFQGIVHDLTERKLAETALRESEARFRELADMLPLAVFEIEGHGNLTFANRNALTTFGYEQTDYERGLNVSQIIVPDDRLRAIEKAMAVMNGEKSGGTEYTAMRKNGDHFPIMVYTSSLANQRKGLRGIVLDLTEQKRAEEQLRLQSAALQSAANAIVITDRDGNVTWVNPSYTRLTGYSFEEVIGKSTRILKSGKQGPAFYKNLWDTILSGRMWNNELINKRKDGSVYNEEMTVTPVRNAQGEITHFVAIKQDVTERKKLQEQLIHAQKMEGIGTLAGGIAHDFNNILGIILGYSTLLVHTKNNAEKFSENMAAINQAVQRGANLVRQILTFARKSETTFELVDVNTMAKELLSMLMQTFPKVVTFSHSIQQGLPPINADPSQIHQALLNLCVNARDAMPKGGTLSLSTGLLSGEDLRKRLSDAVEIQYVFVAVSDTGVGMTDHLKSRIFEPFFTTKELGRGTGLGLAVVYGIVNAHHGFVDVESEQGKGTTFRLYFPIHVGLKEEHKARKPKDGESPQGSSEAILVVEDEELLLNMVRALLEENGYTVFTALDGKEALAVYDLHRDEIKLVLTDMGLPRLSGTEEFIRLREINPDIKVILASGYLDAELKTEMLKAGARAFLQKPYVPGDVLKIIREVLDS